MVLSAGRGSIHGSAPHSSHGPATGSCDPLVKNAVNLGAAWQTMRRAKTAIAEDSSAGLIEPNLTAGEIATLDCIAGSTEAARMSDIASALQVDRSTATRAIDRLVQRGFATRKRDPIDARILRVSLTDAGLKAQLAASEGRLAFAVRVLERFGPDDRQAIGRLMPMIADAMAEEFGVPL